MAELTWAFPWHQQMGPWACLHKPPAEPSLYSEALGEGPYWVDMSCCILIQREKVSRIDELAARLLRAREKRILEMLEGADTGALAQ